MKKEFNTEITEYTEEKVNSVFSVHSVLKYFSFVVAFIAIFFLALPARAAENLMDIYQTYQGDTHKPLVQPHRSIAELSDWVSETAAGALMFSPGKNTQKLNDIRPLFSDNGFKNYTDFLTAMGFASDLQNQTLGITAIVNNAPLLIGQGASADRYAWAFEVPVIMTVMQKGYKTPDTTKVVLRIQFGRSAKGPAPHGVVIESWKQFIEDPQESGGQAATAP